MNYLRVLPITLLFFALATHTQPVHADNQPDPRLEMLSQVLDAAMEYGQLRTVTIAQRGEILAERGYRGHSVTAPAKHQVGIQEHHLRPHRYCDRRD